MNLSRRGFLGGAAVVTLAAPAVITTPGLLMRVRSLFLPTTSITLTRQVVADFQFSNGLLTPLTITHETVAILYKNLVAAGKVNQAFERHYDEIGREGADRARLQRTGDRLTRYQSRS